MSGTGARGRRNGTRAYHVLARPKLPLSGCFGHHCWYAFVLWCGYFLLHCSLFCITSFDDCTRPQHQENYPLSLRCLQRRLGIVYTYNVLSNQNVSHESGMGAPGRRDTETRSYRVLAPPNFPNQDSSLSRRLELTLRTSNQNASRMPESYQQLR